MFIRKATLDDLAEIIRIYDEIHDREEAGEVTTGWLRDIYPTRKTAESSIERGDMFVQENEAGEIVGTGIINQTQVDVYADGDWQFPAANEEIMVLHTLIISVKSGHRGSGKGFLDFYENHAREMGCPYLRLDTNARNTAARAFYRKYGYDEIGIIPTVFNGIPGVELVLLEKRLYMTREHQKMRIFRNAIVRRPCRAMTEGITSGLYPGRPDYELALAQHDAYIEALRRCRINVTVLPADEDYPDSCFVEDPAVLTERCAIITNPRAASRNGEKTYIEKAVREFYPGDRIEHITYPGTLEGGDVMMCGDQIFVGRSERTNAEGIHQFARILQKYGYTCTEVKLTEVLHLKTGVNYLENNNLLVSGEFIGKAEFDQYNRYEVPEKEAYAANCIWVNGTVIVPDGYSAVLDAVKSMGYETITVDTSEFRKLDGGLSCLSLRF